MQAFPVYMKTPVNYLTFCIENGNILIYKNLLCKIIFYLQILFKSFNLNWFNCGSPDVVKSSHKSANILHLLASIML